MTNFPNKRRRPDVTTHAFAHLSRWQKWRKLWHFLVHNTQP